MLSNRCICYMPTQRTDYSSFPSDLPFLKLPIIFSTNQIKNPYHATLIRPSIAPDTASATTVRNYHSLDIEHNRAHLLRVEFFQ